VRCSHRTFNIPPTRSRTFATFPSTENAIVTSTCSFVIVDVRTGFIYGTGETTAMLEHAQSK
jgi:hypothetical protein